MKTIAASIRPRFATGLAGAAAAGQSFDVKTIGHVGFDAQGTAFEVAVSRDRAAGVETALEQIFKQTADAMQLPADRRQLLASN